MISTNFTKKLTALSAAAALTLALGACADPEQEEPQAVSQDFKEVDKPEPTEEETSSKELPTVTFDDAGKPSIDIPAGFDPDELIVETLTEGEGEALKGKDTITANYTGWTLDGEEFDTSWKQGKAKPQTFSLQEVISGWTEGLAGQKVGSQVLLVIPEEKAYGGSEHELAEETLIFVVDIQSSSPPPPADVLPAAHSWVDLAKDFKPSKKAVKALGKEEAQYAVDTGIAAYYDFFNAEAVNYITEGDDRKPSGVDEPLNDWGSERLLELLEAPDGEGFEGTHELWDLFPQLMQEDKDGKRLPHQALMTDLIVYEEFNAENFKINSDDVMAAEPGYEPVVRNPDFKPAKDGEPAIMALYFTYETEISGYEKGSSQLLKYDGVNIDTLYLEETETGAWKVTSPRFVGFMDEDK